MTALMVQQLRLCLPKQGVQVPSLVGELRSHMTWGQKKQNIKQKQYCNKYNKDFKNGPHPKKEKKKKQQGMGWSEVSHQTESLVLDWR